MEFFIPGLLLFIVSILVTFFIAPKAGPIVTAILSIAFLSYGVYDHHRLFAAEYRLSTWQDGLKIYAPAIMIGFIILFIIGSILGFFTSASVPIPSMPDIELPSANSITNTIANSLNNVSNTISNATNNAFGNNNNNKGNSESMLGLFGNNNKGNNKGNNKENNISRSFLETL